MTEFIENLDAFRTGCEDRSRVRRVRGAKAGNDIAAAVARIVRRIAESEKPADEAEEQYLAGLRDALALVKSP